MRFPVLFGGISGRKMKRGRNHPEGIFIFSSARFFVRLQGREIPVAFFFV